MKASFKENGPDKVAAFPSHGTHQRSDMNVCQTTTQFPSPKGNETENGFRILEKPIFELAHMARIAQVLLERTFEVSKPFGTDYLELKLSKDERESLMFAMQDICSRSIILDRAFQSACTGEGKL